MFFLSVNFNLIPCHETLSSCVVCASGVFTLLPDGPHLLKAAAPPHGAQSSLCAQVQLVLLPPAELRLHLCLHRSVQRYGRSHSQQGVIATLGPAPIVLLLLRPQVVWMARYLLELSLLENQCVIFSPMQLAGAALCLARQVLQEPLTPEGEASWYLASSIHVGRYVPGGTAGSGPAGVGDGDLCGV